MRRATGLWIGLAVLLAGCSAGLAEPPFESDWRFIQQDVQNGQAASVDDQSWQAVSIPHDWSIAGPFDEHAPAGGAGAFLPTGIGWYRKHFTLPADAKDKRIFVDFDGVMANSDVWINGEHLGHRPYGYSSFEYELTDHLNFGDEHPNVLAVRADDSQQPASRWYAGAGIYRHARLVVTDPVHFAHWGNFATADLRNNTEVMMCTIAVKSTVVNQSKSARQCVVQLNVVDPDGQTVGSVNMPSQTVPAGGSVTFSPANLVTSPRIWDLDHPDLYQADLQILADGKMLDEQKIPFGIRQFEFKPDTGFWLNGKNFKLKGVCLHDDGGAFGAAVPMGVWQERLKALKEIGVNAIRCAHNPPDPAFLDLCDRMGFLVMDETFDCWTVAKNPFDYHLYFRDWFKTDARDMVLRDRNHPCIILYSAGNEIHDTPKPDVAKPILQDILDVIHAADPSRPVTQALFRPNVSHDYDDGLADMLDVVGQNYRENEILAAHAAKPTRKIVGTENGHDRAGWIALRDNAPYAGQFLWAGIDYLGESRRWPTTTAGAGLLDRTGAIKPRAFERQSWWSDKPMARIARRVMPDRATPADPGFDPLTRLQTQFADWTPKNLDAHEETVEVYSNCDTVELLLNGQSLGSKTKPENASPRAWKVNFAPGKIQAIAKNGDTIVAQDELQTAGKPAKILLTSNCEKLSPDWNDVAFVRATIVDQKGVPVPSAADEITFALTGPGIIAAVDNADNASHEPFQANHRHAYQGACVAMLKATGTAETITVAASAPGLQNGSVTISAIAKK